MIGSRRYQKATAATARTTTQAIAIPAIGPPPVIKQLQNFNSIMFLLASETTL
jgi:hypothetical protein